LKAARRRKTPERRDEDTMTEEAKSKPSGARELSLVGHLEELRYRLIICIVSLFVFTFISFFAAKPVLEFLIKPATIDSPFLPPAPEQERIVLEMAADGSLRVKAPGRLGRIDPEAPPPRLVLEFPAAADGATTQAVDLTRKREGADLIYTNPIDPFMMPFKVAIIMGILLSLGVWVWQTWLFVAPGLTEPEKRVVGPLLFGAIFLFPIGAGFAYGMFFLIIPVMNRYIVPGIETLYTIRDYLKLMTNMMLVFGVIFELPLVVAVLARIGIVTPAFLQQYRRHIYVALAFVAMVITPADPFSMLIALIPLLLLFEASVWVAKIMAVMRRGDFEDDAEGAA
jgi:sec-independent protein translocase protein TatC